MSIKYPGKTLSNEVREKAARITWLVLDVDGVMTDGGLIRGDDGQEYKRFSARDGLGLKMFRRAGFNVAIITARTSQLVADRAAELGVSELHQGQHDKLLVLKDLCARQGLDIEQTAFMGDDLVDYSAMNQAGLGLTVADAYAPMLQHADWISQYPGGHGAVREACEMIMYCQDKLATAHESIIGSIPV